MGVEAISLSSDRMHSEPAHQRCICALCVHVRNDDENKLGKLAREHEARASVQRGWTVLVGWSKVASGGGGELCGICPCTISQVITLGGQASARALAQRTRSAVYKLL